MKAIAIIVFILLTMTLVSQRLSKFTKHVSAHSTRCADAQKLGISLECK